MRSKGFLHRASIIDTVRLADSQPLGLTQQLAGESQPQMGTPCRKGVSGESGRAMRNPSMPGGLRLKLTVTLRSFGQERRRFLGQ